MCTLPQHSLNARHLPSTTRLESGKAARSQKRHMDYKGQRLAELLYCYIIVIVGVIAWIYGYVHQNFKLTFQGWLVGLIISMVLCVPDWPIYNRNPVDWLKEVPSTSSKSKPAKVPSDDDKAVVSEKKKSKSRKR